MANAFRLSKNLYHNEDIRNNTTNFATVNIASKVVYMSNLQGKSLEKYIQSQLSERIETSWRCLELLSSWIIRSLHFNRNNDKCQMTNLYKIWTQYKTFWNRIEKNEIKW